MFLYIAKYILTIYKICKPLSKFKNVTMPKKNLKKIDLQEQ